MTYYKFKIEGWVEMNKEAFIKNGIQLSKAIYEMEEGNGICTAFETTKITDNFEDLDGGAENFFTEPFEDSSEFDVKGEEK